MLRRVTLSVIMKPSPPISPAASAPSRRRRCRACRRSRCRRSRDRSASRAACVRPVPLVSQRGLARARRWSRLSGQRLVEREPGEIEAAQKDSRRRSALQVARRALRRRAPSWPRPLPGSRRARCRPRTSPCSGRDWRPCRACAAARRRDSASPAPAPRAHGDDESSAYFAAKRRGRPARHAGLADHRPALRAGRHVERAARA